MISDAYRELNVELHKTNAGYGTNTLHVAQAKKLQEQYGGTMLDYGCGKGELMRALKCAGYDPAVKAYSSLPEPADIVVCTDVLEHVEPEHIEAVLDHIQTLARKAVFIVIALRPAKKRLSDGRNAHLIVESDQWWRDRIAPRFAIKTESVKPAFELAVVAEAIK